jgi:hypothetical protein
MSLQCNAMALVRVATAHSDLFLKKSHLENRILIASFIIFSLNIFDFKALQCIGTFLQFVDILW